MDLPAPGQSVAERLSASIAGLRADHLPQAVRERCRDLVVDIAGLCVAARREDYVRALTESADGEGPCTALGHTRRFTTAEAALINGTAAHGEDYDDTFEGGPVHAGVVVVPTVLAAAERYAIAGPDLLLGIAVASEVMCRGSLVAPKRIHQAGFHPTAVLGAMGAAAGIAAAGPVPGATCRPGAGRPGTVARGPPA